MEKNLKKSSAVLRGGNCFLLRFIPNPTQHSSNHDQTPTERMYIEDMQTLMPYFKVDTDVLKVLVGQEKEGWERYMAATTQTMKKHLIEEYELQGVIGEVDDRKLDLREIEEIGIALNRWQFVDPKEAMTLAAEVERLKRVERVTSYQEANPQAVGAGQSP